MGRSARAIILIKDMKKYISIAAIAGLAVCLASFVHAKESSFTVVLGQKLGPVALGSSKTDVHKVIGLPYLHRRNHSLEAEYFHVPKSDKDHYLSVIYKHGRVIQIETDSPQFRTPQGITANSSLGQIRSNLGRLPIVSFGQDDPDPDAAEHAQHFYDDVATGLAFELDLGYRADTSPGVVPGGLIVHVAGHSVIAPE